MNTKDLVKLIDTLVEKKFNAKVKQTIKEEVASQVNKVMGNMLVEMIKDYKNPNPTVITSTGRKDYIGKEIQSPIQTSNPKLNTALNETIRNSKPLQRTTSLVDLIDGGFDRVGASGEAFDEVQGQAPEPRVRIAPEDGANMQFLKSMINEGTTTGVQTSVLGTDAVPDVLQGVFKKDFRAVMRKMDEQKKMGTMGMIDPRSVLSG
jgi:hypothetical protein